MPPAFGVVFGVEAEMQERVVMLACDQDHITTVAAIAAARTATRDEFLPAEREATITSVAGFHGYDYFINK
jgi:hypothetical protein